VWPTSTGQLLLNNVVLLAKCAKLSRISAVLTAVETESLGDSIGRSYSTLFPRQEIVDAFRSTHGMLPALEKR
jgi:hypothetical protein